MERVVTWKEIGSYDKMLEVFYMKDTKRWRVAIHDNGEMTKLKSFTSKSQALGFAKNYMRNH